MSSELLELIAKKLDVTDILDLLGMDTYDLVYALRDDILRNREDFEDAIS